MNEGFGFDSVMRVFDGAGRMLDGMVSRVVQDLTAAPVPAGREWGVAIEGFRGVRNGTLALVDDLTQQQADFRRSAESWSIAQIIHHLLLSEKVYREQMESLIALAREGKATSIELTLQDVDSYIPFVPQEVMPAFEVPLKVFHMMTPRVVREAMFRYTVMPAASPAIVRPADSPRIDELLADLHTSLSQTEALFNSGLPANLVVHLKDMTVTHPLMGTNNVTELLSLLGAHEERHQTQIRRIQSDSQYPWNIVL
jgi:hypothetical protein